jgi:hypothetical protein
LGRQRFRTWREGTAYPGEKALFKTRKRPCNTGATAIKEVKTTANHNCNMDEAPEYQLEAKLDRMRAESIRGETPAKRGEVSQPV